MTTIQNFQVSWNNYERTRWDRKDEWEREGRREYEAENREMVRETEAER